MRCIICHGDRIEIMEVKEEVIVGNDIVYVPVKIPVCQTCGERYYDRRTFQFLEDVEEELKAGKRNLREVGKVLVYG